MALQTSGAISLGDIQTEFGGSNPISISEYYGVDTGVPASGTISLSDFYGTSNVDVTLDAWAGGTNLGPGNDSTSGTISGINTSITLRLSCDLLYGFAFYAISGGASGSIPNGSNVDITVSNGNTLTITFSDQSQFGSFNFSGNITARNQSDGNAIYFNISVSSYGSGGGGL